MTARILPLAAFAAAVLATPAWSADLPAMPTKAPVYAPAPAYDWSGFYLGGHVGGAWEQRNIAQFSTVTGASEGSASGNESSVAGGGQIGFNYALSPNWIIGFEADVSATDLEGTGTGVNLRGVVVSQYANKIDLFGTARGRLGYAFNNWLFYGTGGFAWADDRINRTQLVGTIGQATQGTVESVTATGTGWAAGGGIEWGFAPNWTAKVEYLHLDLGTQTFNFPLAMVRRDASVSIDTARFGINYLFNWGAPVAARY
jgi:opacity protein-like surface antigen